MAKRGSGGTRGRFLGAGVALASAVAVAVVGAILLAGQEREREAMPPPGRVAPNRAGFSPGHSILFIPDDQLARDLDAMRATGARWLRVDLDWPSIASRRGVRDWSLPDRVISAARRRDLEVIAMPAYTPEWARPRGKDDKWAPDPDLYANFVEEAVRRYSRAGVRVWEIWNEPNIVTFWQPRPDAEDYARLLRAATRAVRRADPNAIVLTGGTSPALDLADGRSIAPLTFVRRLYDAGARADFDAVAVHPYSFPEHPLDRSATNAFFGVTGIRELMVGRGDGAKQIWGTEFGAPTGDSNIAVSEAEQAALLREAYAAWDRWSWTGPLLWYANRDYGSDLEDPEHNFGLIRFDGSPKPAYRAMRKVVSGPLAPSPGSP